MSQVIAAGSAVTGAGVAVASAAHAASDYVALISTVLGACAALIGACVAALSWWKHRNDANEFTKALSDHTAQDTEHFAELAELLRNHREAME